MRAATFAPARIKAMMREQQHTSAPSGDRWATTMQTWLGPVATTMLDLAQLHPGDRCPDIAIAARTAALRPRSHAAPTATSLAADLAAAIFTIAARAAQARWMANVATRVPGTAHRDLAATTFDAIFPHLRFSHGPDCAAGLAELRPLLGPGGRVVVAGFTALNRNTFVAITLGVIRRRARLPPPAPESPGPFSLGAPGALAALLGQAGFRAVETRIIAPPLRLATTADCARFLRESFGAFAPPLAGLPPAERAAAWAEVERELARFETPDGFAAPSEFIVGAGRR